MSEDASGVIERRRLRRRLSLWRVLAILAMVIALAALSWRALKPSGPHVAEVEISGVILLDPPMLRLLDRLAEEDEARALLVRIDSPGGSVAGSEALHDALRRVAARKPVVAVMGEVAASGGYVAALGTERIFARGGTLTGSIGVVMQFPVVEELLDKLGVDVTRIASSELKAQPTPFEKPSAEVMAAQRALIEDAYDWFVGLVAERRDLTPERARALGDGRVYSGRQAAENGLIDALGGVREARDWLASAHDIAASLPLIKVEPERDQSLARRVFGDEADALTGRAGLRGGLLALWR